MPKFCSAKKWRWLVDSGVKVSDQCCDIMKKNPLNDYHKVSGLHPFVGVMAEESSTRTSMYTKTGCNAYSIKHPISMPMMFWGEKDVWDYIHKYDVPYSKIYNMGEPRTGCMFCMFGVHLEKEPNRFQRMKILHPQLHKYCMETLGLREILAKMGVKYE